MCVCVCVSVHARARVRCCVSMCSDHLPNVSVGIMCECVSLHMYTLSQRCVHSSTHSHMILDDNYTRVVTCLHVAHACTSHVIIC